MDGCVVSSLDGLKLFGCMVVLLCGWIYSWKVGLLNDLVTVWFDGGWLDGRTIEMLDALLNGWVDSQIAGCIFTI